MTNDEQIGRALDKALNDAFPAADPGYPQTDNTRRVANIWLHVCDRLAEAGYTVCAYNFHEGMDGVFYNVKRTDQNGIEWVYAHVEPRGALQYRTDVAMIESTVKYMLADLRGEPLPVEQVKE